jgi:Mn-dependent DtxR family transcriptional regulator
LIEPAEDKKREAAVAADPAEPRLETHRRVMPAADQTSQSVEDYLERIHELIENKGYARPIEIAEALNIKQSSVTKMMQRLHDLGFAHYEKHRGLTLTEAGIGVALRVRRRHEYVAQFLRLIGVEEHSLQRDIEGIEHHISPETMNRLEAFVTFLNEHPRVISEFQKKLQPEK